MNDSLAALALIVGGIIALIIGYYGSYYLIFKSKFSEFRECVDAVDVALKDDNVSEIEFRDVWNKCYTFFKNVGVK
jgi:hypothetical protein